MASKFTPRPPVEKLPLTVRKDIRDNYEPRREALGSKLSDILKQDFKIKINPNETYAYATGGYAQNSHGQMLASYLEAFVTAFELMVKEFPEDAVECFNEVVTKSELIMTADDTGKHGYIGCDVKDGVFRILFAEGYLGNNISDLAYNKKVPQAINDAPRTSDLPLLVKGSIRNDFEKEIPEVKAEIAEMLNIPVDELILDPNFLANYQKMKSHKDQSIWREEIIGKAALEYFKGLQLQIMMQHFKGDELMQEGLMEVISSKTFQLRVVDKLEKGNVNETVIKDGIAYIQTLPNYWRSNTGDAACGLSGLL